MNSIKRITKRVKHSMFALCLDTRGEFIATSPAVMIGGAAAIVAAGVGATASLKGAKSSLDTTNSGSDKLNGSLTTMVGGTPTATPPAVDPTQ